MSDKSNNIGIEFKKMSSRRYPSFSQGIENEIEMEAGTISGNYKLPLVASGEKFDEYYSVVRHDQILEEIEKYDSSDNRDYKDSKLYKNWIKLLKLNPELEGVEFKEGSLSALYKVIQCVCADYNVDDINHQINNKFDNFNDAERLQYRELRKEYTELRGLGLFTRDMEGFYDENSPHAAETIVKMIDHVREQEVVNEKNSTRRLGI